MKGKLSRLFSASSLWKVLKKAIAQLNSRGKLFAVFNQKSAKTSKLYSRLTFVIYGMGLANISDHKIFMFRNWIGKYVASKNLLHSLIFILMHSYMYVYM